MKRSAAAGDVASHPGAPPLGIARAWARVAKRTMDLVVCVPLAVLLAPVMALVALIVRVTSQGPVIFKQHRIGRDGARITVLKFRTMVVDAEARLLEDPAFRDRYVEGGYKILDESDPRLTRVGRILRRTSVDELPQLWCVITGSMSLVGPRPVLEREGPQLYGPDFATYLVAKPGLTGLWQVSGRCDVPRRERARLDVRYVEEWTLRGDARILLRTIPAVLSGRGAY